MLDDLKDNAPGRRLRAIGRRDSAECYVRAPRGDFGETRRQA